jgi:hypothetical protein
VCAKKYKFIGGLKLGYNIFQKNKIKLGYNREKGENTIS